MSVGATGHHDLDARFDALQGERERLLAALPSMDPLMAARASNALADRLSALRNEYEATLHPGRPA
jgi:hypothetical protein